MVTVDKAQIAKLSVEGDHFEVLVDGDLAQQLKAGKSVAMADVLAINTVYTDAKKGMEASPTAIQKAFNTDDALEVGKTIILKGSVPISTEYKRQLFEQKYKQIVDIIVRNGVDPKTHTPHPPQRIENAMEEVGVKIDDGKEASAQVGTILKQLQTVLPIKFAIKEIAIKIPASEAAKSYNVLNALGKKIKEDWQSDGSYLCVLEIPGGMEETLYSKLNAATHGNVEAKVLNVR